MSKVPGNGETGAAAASRGGYGHQGDGAPPRHPAVRLAEMDSLIYSRKARKAVNQALQTPLGPGESLPLSVKLFPTVPDADWADRQDLIPSGSVLYVPEAGMARVHINGQSGPANIASGDMPGQGKYAGSARIARALTDRGPVPGALAKTPPQSISDAGPVALAFSSLTGITGDVRPRTDSPRAGSGRVGFLTAVIRRGRGR